MSLEEDSEQVPSFSFIPVCTPEDGNSTGDRIRFSCIGLDPNSATLGNTEQVVHNLESLVPVGVICTTDVHAAFKLTLRVVSQERKHRNDTRRGDVESEFVLENGELLDEFGQTLHEISAIGMQGFSGLCMKRDSWIRRCRFLEWGDRSW